MTDKEYAQLVRQQAAANVPSLELKYQVISDCYSKLPVAYRGETAANSVYMGTLTEKDYTYATDTSSDVGVRLAKWNVVNAINDINKLLKLGKKPLFVSVRCPAALADEDDLYGQIKSIINKCGLKDASKLCLEFTQSLLYLTGEKAAKNIIDMKLLGVQTMVSGVGAYDCPASKILDIPVDWCMLDKNTVALATSRDKPRVLPTFAQYLKSMNVRLMADGVTDDEQVNTLLRLDFAGVTTADNYEGTIKYPLKGLTFEEISVQQEKS